VFEIEDTGIGMEPSFVEEAIKPFRQESVGDNREYEGSGLGLAIVDRYVRLLDGSIAIDTKKGEGTCVRVTLPGSSEADLSAPGAASS
jgi:signal transduction histidine kinase